MKPTLHSVAPNTPEWLALRKGYRTASELAIVCGVSPFTTPERFKLIKAGVVQQYYSAAMRRGHETEARTREWANRHFGLVFEEQIWTRGNYLASLDGIDAGVVLEIKASSHTYDAVARGDIPRYYRLQIHQQLYCSGSEKAYLVAWCPKTDRYIASDPIFPDPEFVNLADIAWAKFESLPMPEGPADVGDNLNLRRLFESYASQKALIEREQAELDRLRDEILAHKAPDRTVTCAGYEIVYKKPSKKVDYKAATVGMDLSKYTTWADEPSYSLKMAPPPFSVDVFDE